MSVFRSLPALAFAVAVFASAVPAFADDAHLDKSSAFIRDLADRAIDTLTQSDLSSEERRDRFRDLFEDGFAIDGIARFVLGRYWRTADDAQKSEYLELFKREIVETWADRFADYSGQRFDVGQASPAPSASDSEKVAIVESTFFTDPTTPVKVEWRVASRGDLFKITDVLVEGLSMARTQRDDYAAVISRNGGDIDALLEELRRRSAGN